MIKKNIATAFGIVIGISIFSCQAMLRRQVARPAITQRNGQHMRPIMAPKRNQHCNQRGERLSNWMKEKRGAPTSGIKEQFKKDFPLTVTNDNRLIEKHEKLATAVAIEHQIYNKSFNDADRMGKLALRASAVAGIAMIPFSIEASICLAFVGLQIGVAGGYAQLGNGNTSKKQLESLEYDFHDVLCNVLHRNHTDGAIKTNDENKS